MSEGWYYKNKDKPGVRDRQNQKTKKYYRENPSCLLYTAAHRRSKHKRIEFNLKTSDIIIPDSCPVLNTDFVPNSQMAMSLDRIDNSKGYLPGNIQVISRRANSMKNDATVDELRDFARWVFRTYGDPDQEYLEMN